MLVLFKNYTCLSTGNHVTSKEHEARHVTGFVQSTSPFDLMKAFVLYKSVWE